MATVGKITLPVFVRVGSGKEVHLADLEMDVKATGSTIKAPTAREIRAALRKALR